MCGKRMERNPKNKEGISNYEIKCNSTQRRVRGEIYKDDAQRGHKIAAECDRAAV